MSVFELIRDYVAATTATAAVLRVELGTDQLEGGWQQRKFPRTGTLRDGSEYQFHGIGVSVVRNDIEVDFDFGPGGRTDGFDAWRLWRFATNRGSQYPEFQDLKAVEAALKSAIDMGAARRSGDAHDYLFYLSS